MLKLDKRFSEQDPESDIYNYLSVLVNLILSI